VPSDTGPLSGTAGNSLVGPSTSGGFAMRPRYERATPDATGHPAKALRPVNFWPITS
jgi:hypothetical protein